MLCAHGNNTFSSGDPPAVVKQLLSTSNALATNLQIQQVIQAFTVS